MSERFQTNRAWAVMALASLLTACGAAASTAQPSSGSAEGVATSGDAESSSAESARATPEEPESMGLPTELTDSQIMVFVLAELIESPAVDAYRVDVTVEDGIATLEGQVDHLLAERHAVEIAKNVRGVRAVIDRLTVAPSGRRDRRIEQSVEDALLFDPAIDDELLSVSVDDGIVTVSGTVASIADEQIVDDVVASVFGVRGVETELETAPPPERSDDELLRDLERAYATSASIDGELMQVAVADGEVTLSGFIGSAAERTRARKLAYLAGASSVDDEGLLVQWWRRDEMSRDVGDPSDDWIAEGLEAAIGLDPRVGDEDEIGISVRRGVVTLTGSVDDLMAARAARRVAENTTGVRRVYSYLRVRPREELMDEQLESRVEARLAADPYTQSFNMTAEVYQGVLTLSGNVHSNFERERAEEAAAGVDGIIAIENHLDVREPARHLSDVELAHDVASKLERDAWVATGSVVVSAVAGVVALEGSVTSPNAKRRAIDDAYDAGARRVDAEALVIRF